MKISDYWNEETGIARYIIKDNNKTYVGCAQCHDEDKDMQSEKIGLTIAMYRAAIDCVKGRKAEAKLVLKAYNHLWSCMEQSTTQFNPKSYEATMIKRKIKQLETEIQNYDYTIAALKITIQGYITAKDALHKSIRSIRSNNTVKNEPSENQ